MNITKRIGMTRYWRRMKMILVLFKYIVMMRYEIIVYAERTAMSNGYINGCCTSIDVPITNIILAC